MFRKCSLCFIKAIKQCECSKEYFCMKHCKKHILERGNHNMIDIDTEQRTQLIEELSSRLRAIHKCKARISAHASYLINQIEELSACAIAKLNKLASDYNKLMTTKEFSESQMEEMSRILTTDFRVKFDSVLEKVNKTEEYFAQQFCEQSPASKLKRFWQTHTGQICCVAATTDQQTIVSGGNDCSIKLWSVASKKVTNVLEGHTKAVTSIAISKNDRYIVSGSFDRTVRVWSLSECHQLFALAGHTKMVASVAFSNDCSWIASGSFDNSVCIWSFDEQRLHKKLTEHTGWVRAVAFTEQKLFSASADGRIIEWDIGTLCQISRLKAETRVMCLDISDDYTQIASGLDNGKIQLWQNRKLEGELPGHGDWVMALKFACRNSRIISASHDKTIRVWSTKQRCLIVSMTDHSNWVASLAILSDKLFVSGSWDCSMIVWNASSFTKNSVIRPQPVDFSAIIFDENRLIYPSGKRVRVWNTDKNYLDAEFQGHSDLVECVAAHCDSIVSGSQDCSVCVWNLKTGTKVGTFTGHTDSVLAVAICGDIVASGSADKTVRLWNQKTSKAAGVLRGHTESVISVELACSADTVVSSSNDKNIGVWSLSRLEVLFMLTGHTRSIEQVGLSKDYKYIFSGSEECVRVWEIKSGVQMHCWENLREAEELLSIYPELRRLAGRFLF